MKRITRSIFYKIFYFLFKKYSNIWQLIPVTLRENYLQVRGRAMSTEFAPSYANIFMDKFEQKHTYLLIKGKTNIYLRCIENIFMVWASSKQELDKFITTLNSCHLSVNSDFEYSQKSINVLTPKFIYGNPTN